MTHLTLMFSSLNEGKSKSIVSIILLLIKLATSHIKFKSPWIAKMPVNSGPQARSSNKIQQTVSMQNVLYNLQILKMIDRF